MAREQIREPENELDFGSGGEENSRKPVPSRGEEIQTGIGERPITDYIFCHADNYSFKTWGEMFPGGKVKLRSLVFNPAWSEFFDIVEKKPYFRNMEKILSKEVANKKRTVLPYAELVFNSLNVLSPRRINVVFLGQDPYININKIKGKFIPQAMGFSFSVPWKYPKPPSLHNIYDNIVRFGHLKKTPEQGCLAGWIMQGCFMVNASFTTIEGRSNEHKNIWQEFTKDLIKYLNGACKKLVFLAWGKEAHVLCLNVDPQKHHIITSSHPSPHAYADPYTGYAYGLGANNRARATYPPFKTTDHFGQINEYLRSAGKTEIFWDLMDF